MKEDNKDETREFKALNKLIYNEKMFNNKIEDDEKKLKKSYIFFFNEMSSINDQLKEKITGKKTKKVAFEQKDDSNKEKKDVSNKEQKNIPNKEQSFLGNIKYCFYVILKNLKTLSKNNFDGDQSIDNIIKKLNNIINKEDFNGTLKEEALPLSWYGTYLQSYIDKIPTDYKDNNYSKLYDELIDEYSKSLDNYKNDESLNILYNKIINGENMIEISQNFLTKIKKDQKKLDILHFILTKQIPIKIIIYTDKEEKISLIEIMKPKDKSNSKGKKESKQCNNILDFCDIFPDLTENIEDIFKFEEEIQLKNALNEYFEIIYEYLDKENIFKKCQEEEKTNLKIKIQDFIYEQIYDRIYPHDFKDPLDIKILQNCFTHKWIKPNNLDEKLINLDDNMVQMMRTFIRKIEERKSPNYKLKEFENLDFMVNNIILLHEYPEDNYLKIMCLVIIKEMAYKPFRLNSLYRYIKMFYYKEKENGIINQLEQVFKEINEFSFKNVVGISEDEYKKNIKNALKPGSQ
jgi:hypothetical protein